MQQLAIAPAVKESVPTIPGTPFAGGFYAGLIRENNNVYAIVVAPKDGGEHDDAEWNESTDDSIPGALSFYDGAANTAAMSEAGSSLATWARELQLNGFHDWYIPAQDELEIAYRNLKPSTQSNYLWARSGINVSAALPTYPYTAEWPGQTPSEVFRSGGAEAFDTAWYWTSTQDAYNDDSAWIQGFSDGGQDNDRKSYEYRARAVRRVLVIQ